MKTWLKCLLMLCAVSLLAQPALSPTGSSAQSNTRYFPPTNKAVSGRFLDYWQANGGVEQQGYPISDQLPEKSDTDGKVYTVQYFERAVFEAHPENKPPYDVLLSLLGSGLYKQKYPNGAPAQTPNNSAGSLFFGQTGKRLGGKFLQYWQEHGGLTQQGYPISDEFQEKSDLDGKVYTVQYFERAVFELHPENAGTPYEVLLSQLGMMQWRARGVAGTPTGTARPTNSIAPSALPPVPSSLPAHMSVGLLNGDPAVLPFDADVPLDYRYQYLAGGVGTANGWANWQKPSGAFATNYIAASNALNLSSVFVYYQLVQSPPHGNEYDTLNDPVVMRLYYDDFKLLMQKVASASPKGRVLVNIEPDLNGVMQMHPSNKADDASQQSTSVASSGQADVQGLPNTFRGFYQALAHIRDVYAPGVLLGLDVSHWGTGRDVTVDLRRDAATDWPSHAARTAAYLNSLGTPQQFEILFYSPLDRDSAYFQLQQGSDRWWDDTNAKEPTFNTMGAWLGKVITITGRRAMLWQVPVGNRVYRTENNTPGHYQDNRAEYFLNPTSGRAHMGEWANLGVVGILWGAGDGNQTHYYDARGDGVTNPAPINGNNEISAYPDDDGGYLRLRIAAYYASGTLALPGVGR